jgi:hypothetical protein
MNRKQHVMGHLHACTSVFAGVQAVVDAIAGTGERLMHCFIRQETEVFFRVEESE